MSYLYHIHLFNYFILLEKKPCSSCVFIDCVSPRLKIELSAVCRHCRSKADDDSPASTQPPICAYSERSSYDVSFVEPRSPLLALRPRGPPPRGLPYGAGAGPSLGPPHEARSAPSRPSPGPQRGTRTTPRGRRQALQLDIRTENPLFSQRIPAYVRPSTNGEQSLPATAACGYDSVADGTARATVMSGYSSACVTEDVMTALSGYSSAYVTEETAPATALSGYSSAYVTEETAPATALSRCNSAYVTEDAMTANCGYNSAYVTEETAPATALSGYSSSYVTEETAPATALSGYSSAYVTEDAMTVNCGYNSAYVTEETAPVEAVSGYNSDYVTEDAVTANCGYNSVDYVNVPLTLIALRPREPLTVTSLGREQQDASPARGTEQRHDRRREERNCHGATCTNRRPESYTVC